LGGGFLGEEVFEALANVLVPALGAIEAALAGGVVQVEEKEELADYAAHGHGTPACRVKHGGRGSSEWDHSRV
jgi:hypothetical protein